MKKKRRRRRLPWTLGERPENIRGGAAEKLEDRLGS